MKFKFVPVKSVYPEVIVPEVLLSNPLILTLPMYSSEISFPTESQ